MAKAMQEEWRDIKGYEGMYQVSNTGKVLSCKRFQSVIDSGMNYKREIGGKVIKLQKDKFGYMYVSLHKDGIRKMFKVHRLVAEAFIPNPFGKEYVNHIDEDKSNNLYTNLSWVDFKENVDYSKSRLIARVSEVGKIEKVYNSINEIKEDGYSPSTVTHIVNKSRKIKTHGGKRWIEIPREVARWENVI